MPISVSLFHYTKYTKDNFLDSFCLDADNSYCDSSDMSCQPFILTFEQILCVDTICNCPLKQWQDHTEQTGPSMSLFYKDHQLFMATSRCFGSLVGRHWTQEHSYYLVLLSNYIVTLITQYCYGMTLKTKKRHYASIWIGTFFRILFLTSSIWNSEYADKYMTLESF